ncbi:1-(5-phosphoribosyl)-5-[(5-phosphoribosylamino)methylideneamino] imidazole-4-carboxamide isomerase [Melghiribacillus thermohalophilus]|uniref:1-(5-phosphoribosyl)-5-[(5-phosphoribosylamino)methylideneamino] imidazole-4-carboxamide isomerase n=1 Tax=Melghiribacillus thermohalophilus TaxID=1324956 RepID=A0A4R3NA42_9BACI|nr:1-(5-phosphoribosyl)-5-[(5-phosphoribosylamino)methylideneamino]imidazole-4-carboxamide isomerase [Melghiribacillus thermohalophilus]TCT25484.1 1-(5-phosphoribosyl)-5-[(5-phosphoribosylamino)methylideneamino] imidazole-4-carboxamide isomerase [Melghiribacillus thermohalophilus]
MIIFPAIDIRNGKCVRLMQGQYDQEEVYGDPAEMAKKWASKGGEYLHLVDLDGALTGKAENLPVIQSIVQSVNIPVQVGGGIRSIEQIESYLDAGVRRVITGTSALQHENFLKQAIQRFSRKLAVSIDAKNGFVATDGWTKTSNVRAVDFARKLEDLGLKTIIYTDIAKDGMLSGPNFQELQAINEAVKMDVIASGGITTKKDIQTLKQYNLYGAIIGKALYTGNIELEEMLKEV